MKDPIHKAISTVLGSSPEPLTPREIYDQIVAGSLYSFKAADPLSVVKSDLRRHCKELDFPSSRMVKYFSMTPDGRFRLLEKPIRVPSSLYKVTSKAMGGKNGTLVSVPKDDEETGTDGQATGGPCHAEIQWRLLDLGAQLGLSVWAPMNDRGRCWNGHRLGEVPRLLPKLPVQFDVPTTKTIENIDVIWLDRSAIIAGFEVEHTSSIYSGLLRMSDLLTMQPNIEIKFYLVAPDERADKFAREVARSTFSSLRKPLHSLCRFLPYSNLLDRLEKAKDLIRHLRPAFLDDIAESYSPTDSEEQSAP